MTRNGYARLMAALDPKTLDILDQILREQFPRVRWRVAKLGLAALDAHVWRQLTDAFADELMRSGFKVDWEPSERGLALEELIDLVCINDDEPTA